MATQKISEMTEAILLENNDVIPIVQSGVNKKVKARLLKDYENLLNKPTLNNVTIEDNKKLDDFNITKENQGIKINQNTLQTLELEIPTDLEIQTRADVNKAITIAVADKMAKETAHQEMSKEYDPNSQELLTEGENQPVSYRAAKEYIDKLENKVNENKDASDIEIQNLKQKNSDLTESINIAAEQLNKNSENIEQFSNIFEITPSQQEITWQGFYYINTNNNKVSIEQTAASSCVLSDPIHLNINDTIKITTTQAAQRQVISLTDKKQTYYETGILSEGAMKEYSYTAIKECYVVVSCYDDNSGLFQPNETFELSIVPGSSKVCNNLQNQIDEIKSLNTPNHYGVFNAEGINTVNKTIKQNATIELVISNNGEVYNKWFYGSASTNMFAVYLSKDINGYGIRVSLNLGDYKTVQVPYILDEIIHIVISFEFGDVTRKKAYINGILIGENEIEGTFSNNIYDYISTTGVTLYQKRIWERVLSDEEIKRLYNNNFPLQFNLPQNMRKMLYSELRPVNINKTFWYEIIQGQEIKFEGDYSLVNKVEDVYNQTTNNEQKINDLLLKIDDVVEQLIYPEFEIKKANRGNHDCTFINDKLVSFNKPSDGLTSVLNSETLAKEKKLKINFIEDTTRELEMKSCDYKYNKLLVGNGRAIKYGESSYEEQGAKLYIFNEANTWLEKTQEDEINFDTCGVYDIIDISELGYKVYGFWGQFDDCIYVSCNLFNDIYLIQLGKGSTKFSNGNYVENIEDRYNGTYEIINHWHQDNGLGEYSAHGGQFYNGKLYIATNDQKQCRIYECIFKNNGDLKFKALDFIFKSEDDPSILKYCYIDGICIKDNILYAQPLLFNNSWEYNTNMIVSKI